MWLSGGPDAAVPVILTTIGVAALSVLGVGAPAVDVPVMALVPGTASWLEPVSMTGVLLLLNVDALRAVQTIGPNDTKHGQIRFARKVDRTNKDRTKHRSTRLEQMN